MGRERMRKGRDREGDRWDRRGENESDAAGERWERGGGRE